MEQKRPSIPMQVQAFRRRNLGLALVVVALILAGVLITNLVRLITDRKRGILGSRLRTKLVFFFLALVLAPAIILFSGSAQIIKRTVEAILSTPHDLGRESQRIFDESRDYFQSQARRRAAAIAGQIAQGDYLAVERREDLARLLEGWQQQADHQRSPSGRASSFRIRVRSSRALNGLTT